MAMTATQQPGTTPTTMQRPLQPDDLFNLTLVGDVTISPDGGTVVYVQTRMDRGANEYRADLWVVATAGGTARQLTREPRVAGMPRYSPDGTWLAFTSDRAEKGKRHLYTMPTDGGEARQLTHGEYGVGDYSWSPDSTRLVFTRTETEGKRHEDAATKKDDLPPEQRVTDDVRTIDRVRNKLDGRGWTYDRRTHLWLVDLEGQESRLTHGPYDETAPAWSPDGYRIAYVSRRGDDADFHNNFDLYVRYIEGDVERLLPTPPGPLDAPVWSPDSALIAYVGSDQLDGAGANSDLWVIPPHVTDAGAARNLTGGSDMSIGLDVGSDARAGLSAMRPAWSPEGDALYAVASVRGDSPLWRVSLEDGAMTQVVGGTRQVQSFAWDAKGETLALNLGDLRNPGDVYVSTDGAASARRTDTNGAFFAGVELARPEAFTYTGPKGWEVHGWLVPPVGVAEDVKAPLVLEIHGGPHTAYGNAFNFEFQLLAAQGWGVLFTNPRGSTGYGEAFTKASNDDWGGDDYRDLMAGVDAALARAPWADAERLGVLGGSYGGYMTNWIVTQTPRFKAAVTLRSICNMVSKWGTSDIGYYGNDLQWGGPPWTNMAFYLERSPLTHVANVTTPLLILHAENDLRCRIEQGEQFFTALKYLRREVKMVRFPDEGHELSRSGQPLHRLENAQQIVGWFRDHL